ncbi:Pet100 protein [Starmerella bacillaris]|uniref:Pet100 protein n=1 Tax=Starmerella bacillaris TaxID=1247836 RepID=A0AAV5RGI1_STABA|nr:Pet100 protein [Starmerella bacillaris]
MNTNYTKWFRRWIPTGANLEIFRFAVYITAPICLMLYVGNNTHDKLNIEDFWPDPNRLNQIPKDRDELKREIERMKRDREERRKLRESSKEQSN